MKNMDSTFAVAFFSMAPVVRLNVCWSCSVLSLFAIDNIWWYRCHFSLNKGPEKSFELRGLPNLSFQLLNSLCYWSSWDYRRCRLTTDCLRLLIWKRDLWIFLAGSESSREGSRVWCVIFSRNTSTEGITVKEIELGHVAQKIEIREIEMKGL